MKFIFILFLIPVISGAQTINLFTDQEVEFSSSYGDMAIHDDEIWIYRSFSDITSEVQLTKYNLNGVVEATGPKFDSDIISEYRWGSKIMAIDTAGNVYASRLYQGQDGTDDIDIYKINNSGDLLWQISVPTPNLNAELSNGVILNNQLICVGNSLNADADAYEVYTWFLSISMDEGIISFNKLTEEAGLKSYTDVVIFDEKIHTLKIELINEDLREYKTSLLVLDQMGNESLEYTIPTVGFLGTNLAFYNNNDVFVSGYVNGISRLLKYNLNQNDNIWDKVVMDAFDDSDYDISIFQDKIIGSHTTFPRGLNSIPGSGIEAFIGIHDTSGLLLDSLFVDYNDQKETIIYKSLVHDSRLFICGEEEARPTVLNPAIGFWGYIELDNLLVGNTRINDKERNLKIHPNPIKPYQILHTNNFYFTAYKIIDIHGKIIESKKLDILKNELLIPNLLFGCYTLILQTDQNISSHKLIIH